MRDLSLGFKTLNRAKNPMYFIDLTAVQPFEQRAQSPQGSTGPDSADHYITIEEAAWPESGHEVQKSTGEKPTKYFTACIRNHTLSLSSRKILSSHWLTSFAPIGLGTELKD
jgi:hypothetical protein